MIFTISITLLITSSICYIVHLYNTRQWKHNSEVKDTTIKGLVSLNDQALDRLERNKIVIQSYITEIQNLENTIIKRKKISSIKEKINVDDDAFDKYVDKMTGV